MFDKFVKIIMAIGIPSIVCACIYIGKKLQILTDLQSTMKKIKGNIKIISDCLISSPINFDHDKLESYSPFRLTKTGEEYLKKIGFIKIFNDHSLDFFNFISSEEPKAEYDIEISAMKSILVLFDKEYFQPLKKYLYTHPQEENLRSVVKYMGVYVCEKYLEKYPLKNAKETNQQK